MRLADAADAGDVFALWGELGAGKSTFARAFIRHYAQVRDVTIDDVPSPTFTLIQMYDVAGQLLWHFDLYRIGQADEIWEIGLEEALGGGICLIEWPGNAGSLLPEQRIDIFLDHGENPDRRDVRLVDRSGTGARFASAFSGLGVS